MKKVILSIWFIGGMLSIASCAKKTTGSLTASNGGPEAAVAEVKAKYSEAQMEEGKTVWQGSCQKCHKLYEPQSHSVKQWEKILPRMSKKANLTEEQAGKVRAYLLTHASSMS